MSDQEALVTVFRSPYHDAREEAERVCQTLVDAGIAAIVVDDDTPGVVSGTYEVRVPPKDAGMAERIVAQEEREESEEDEAAGEVDPSHRLDPETVFTSSGAMAEMQALTIHSMLQSNDLSPVIVGASTIPSLHFEVRVPREQAERALELISEARASGPEAAEEAERSGESEQ